MNPLIRSWFRTLLVFLSLLASPFSGTAQDVQALPGPPTTATEFQRRVAEIRGYLQEFADTSAVPGVSLALGVGERFTRYEAFGYADLESERLATSHTRFRVGSVSKTFTATALGLLVEDGHLELDSEIQRYVPGFPEKTHPMTLRHVAGHQAGIRHYKGDEALSNRSFESVIEALSVFEDDPLVAEPGTAFTYSTHGYTLLSAAMERASGLPFLELMKERVMDPLGMTRTGPEWKGHLHPQQATGYEPAVGGGVEVPPETDLSNKWAGGGFVSTAGDLLKFARAHLRGDFLRPETLDMLWSPQTTSDGTEIPRGIGWQSATMPEGIGIRVAGGNAIGGTTVMFVLPEEDVVVVFMTNIGNAPIRGVPMKVVRMLLGIEANP